MNNQTQTYPTQWQLGKPGGSYQLAPKQNPFAVKVVMSPPEEKQYSKTFTFSVYGGKENAEKEASKWRLDEAIKLNQVDNQIRYLDKDTIEVKLTKGKTMKTDAKHIDKVQKYSMHAKYREPNSENAVGRWYAVCQNKKESAFNFGQLICNCNKISFLNGDSLDLRESNLLGAGDIPLGEVIIGKEKVRLSQKMIDIQYECKQKDIEELPKNVWILGKHAGYTIEKDDGNSIEVRLHDQDEKQKSQTLNSKNYKSKEEFNSAVEKLSIELSYKAGKTKNLIKIIDDNTIEVELTQGEIMKTDKVFIPIFKKILVCTSISGNGIKYATISNGETNKQYHSFITGFDMTDHIDGITLNNTLKNLRFCTVSMNNSNRHVINNKHGFTGIKLEETNYGFSYVARITINNRQFTKNFNVNVYGNDEAKQMAIEFRKKAENVTKYVSNVNEDDDEQLLKIELIKLSNTMKHIKSRTIFDKSKYLQGIDLTYEERNNIHLYYLEEQMKYYKWCKEEYDRISKILIKKITKI